MYRFSCGEGILSLRICLCFILRPLHQLPVSTGCLLQLLDADSNEENPNAAYILFMLNPNAAYISNKSEY